MKIQYKPISQQDWIELCIFCISFVTAAIFIFWSFKTAWDFHHE